MKPKRYTVHGNGATPRFEFGKNWKQFLRVLDEARIVAAENSLKRMLDEDQLDAKTFLDIGSGSGLFSLAARRLGASVHSLDYDPQSVACAAELKHRYFADDLSWVIEEGSVLDPETVSRLNQYDIVYSWGVLHHTGAMWIALENAISRVGTDGRLFIAIYNDQGWKSHFWWFVKLFYNKLRRGLNTLYAYTVGCAAHALNIIKYTLRFKPMTAVRPLIHRKNKRGMSVMRDLIDWIGGYPYEFAQYEVLEDYLKSRGFELIRGTRATSLGCHEMVFRRMPASFME